MVPVAGSWKAFGISITTSGLIFQPSWKVLGAALSLASPSGAPLSTHATRVWICASLSLRSLAKWPILGSANHGGIFWLTTAALMALAHGRASVQVRSDIGAISPGRWHC